MARNPEPVVKVQNFKELYNKKYGDIVTVQASSRYTPEQIFDLAVRYFTWAEQNHIQAAETASFQGDVYESKVHKPRVFTLTGFSLFSGISDSNIQRLRKLPGYSDVMAFIDSVVFEQKFQLAAHNMINPGLIGKEIGIDKPASINVEATADSSIESVTAEEVKKAVHDVLDMLNQ